MENVKIYQYFVLTQQFRKYDAAKKNVNSVSNDTLTIELNHFFTKIFVHQKKIVGKSYTTLLAKYLYLQNISDPSLAIKTSSLDKIFVIKKS